MKENEAILKRQKYNIRFKNADMDFMLNWAIGISQIIGMAPSQAFYAVHGIKDGDPVGWRKGFQAQGDYQLERAGEFIRNGQKLAAGQLSLGAAYAYRAAIQYTDPTTTDFDQRVQAMQNSDVAGRSALRTDHVARLFPGAGSPAAPAGDDGGRRGYFLRRPVLLCRLPGLETRL
jgi:hypothetical protein